MKAIGIICSIFFVLTVTILLFQLMGEVYPSVDTSDLTLAQNGLFVWLLLTGIGAAIFLGMPD